MKTYLTALLSFLIAPALAFGALDVTLSGSSVISVGGYSLVVSGSASIDSISVDTSSFSVVLSSGASLTVTSADRKAFSVSPSSLTTSQTCSTAQSLVTVGMASGPVTTVTITPSASNCTLSEGGVFSGGSGGGGGGGGGAPPSVYTVIPGTASSASSAAGTAASSVSSTATVAVTKPVALPGGLIVALTKSLKLGSENSEVKALQKALAQDKTIYPEGKATGYYGPATRNAIIRFQKKYGIEPVGFVGPQTRKKLNEIYGTAMTQTSSASSAAASSATSSVQPSTTSSASSVSGASKAQQIQSVQTLINKLLEQIKALQAKKTQ